MAEEHGMADKPLYGPQGRGFYGTVTVSERGQVSIPAQARRDLNIQPGDKLLVLGDPEQGLALVALETLMQNAAGSAQLIRAARAIIDSEATPDGE